jgi:hypothetical protein
VITLERIIQAHTFIQVRVETQKPHCLVKVDPGVFKIAGIHWGTTHGGVVEGPLSLTSWR